MKKTKTHNVFEGILGDIYSKNTVFSGKRHIQKRGESTYGA